MITEPVLKKYFLFIFWYVVDFGLNIYFFINLYKKKLYILIYKYD